MRARHLVQRALGRSRHNPSSRNPQAGQTRARAKRWPATRRRPVIASASATVKRRNEQRSGTISQLAWSKLHRGFLRNEVDSSRRLRASTVTWRPIAAWLSSPLSIFWHSIASSDDANEARAELVSEGRSAPTVAPQGYSDSRDL